MAVVVAEVVVAAEEATLRQPPLPTPTHQLRQPLLLPPIKTILLVGVVGFGLALRVFLVGYLPFTNDEGAYLFDARLISEGHLPAGDIITKAPVPVLAFASSVWLTGHSLFANRLVTTLANVLTVFPIAWLLHRQHSQGAAIRATGLWFLCGLPIPMIIFGHTETIAALGTITCFTVWWSTLEPTNTRSQTIRLAVITAVVFVLAFASRKTSLVLLLPGLWLWVQSCSFQRKTAAITFCLSLVLGLIPWLVIVHSLYGPPGVREASGVGYGSLLFSELATFSKVEGLRHALAVAGRIGSGSIVLTLLGLVWVGMRKRRHEVLFQALLLWLGSLVVMYSSWPQFLPEYLIDLFLPASVLGLFAVADIWTWRPQWGRVLVATLLIITFINYWSAWQKPWTGMFTRSAVNQAASLLKTTVPLDQPILTAAVIVPYRSGHDVLLNITHPLWYRYQAITPTTKSAFLPPLGQVEDYLTQRRVQWALVEHLTDYAYLRHESNLIMELIDRWHLVATIPNNTGFRSNPLHLYAAPEAAVLQ